MEDYPAQRSSGSLDALRKVQEEPKPSQPLCWMSLQRIQAEEKIHPPPSFMMAVTPKDTGQREDKPSPPLLWMP